MNVKVTGKVVLITNEEVINPEFKKKGVLLETTEVNGEKEFTIPYFIEFYNDKISQLDNLKNGEEKTINFNIRCREFEDSNGKKYFTSLTGWKVE